MGLVYFYNPESSTLQPVLYRFEILTLTNSGENKSRLAVHELPQQLAPVTIAGNSRTAVHTDHSLIIPSPLARQNCWRKWGTDIKTEDTNVKQLSPKADRKPGLEQSEFI